MEKKALKNDIKMVVGFDIKPINWVEAKRQEYHVFFADDVKGAVAFAIEQANNLENLENRGHALDVIQSAFPDEFTELKLNSSKDVKHKEK